MTSGAVIFTVYPATPMASTFSPQLSSPSLSTPHFRAVGSAFGAVCFLILALPIFNQLAGTSGIVPPPEIPQITHLKPPILDEPLPTPVSAQADPDSLPILAPDAPRPPDAQPLDLVWDPLSPPVGGIEIGYNFGHGDYNALEATLAELDFIPQTLVTVAPKVGRLNRTASVWAELRVDAEGRVTAVRILESENASLDSRVREALLQWKFQPGLRQGRPTAFILRQRFNFHP